MKDKNDILSKRIRERLKDFEQPVPDHIWSAIEEDLVPTVGISRTKVLWRRLAIAASFLLILSVGTLFFLNRNDEEPKIVENKIEKQISKSTQSLLAEQNRQEEQPQEIVETKTITKSSHRNSPLAEHVQKAEISTTKSEEVSRKTELQKTSEIAENKSEKEKDQPVKQDKKMSSFYEDAMADNNLLNNLSGRKKKYGGVSYALAVGNSGNFGRESNVPYHVNEGMMFSPSSANDPIYTNSGGNVDFTKRYNVFTAKNDETTPAEYNYALPISVGFTVRKHFSKVFALETGLVYTYLASEGKVVSNVPITNNISLNYLGIPVKAVYSFYDSKRLSVYASAGGMVEKSVYGKFQSTVDYKTKSKDLNVKELQFSVAGSVGINFQLVGRLGLFIEPGVAYYFDDGSKIETIRKDQPFNFSLQGGLRLTY